MQHATSGFSELKSQIMTIKNKFSLRAYPTTAHSDTRLLVCLPREYEWRKLSPKNIHDELVKKLAILPAIFRIIKLTYPGFATSSFCTVARKNILLA